MQEEEVVKFIIENKCTLSHKELVICDLREHLPDRRSGGYNYQVHCDNKYHRFSHIYDDIDIAVDKFIGIKHAMESADESKGKD